MYRTQPKLYSLVCHMICHLIPTHSVVSVRWIGCRARFIYPNLSALACAMSPMYVSLVSACYLHLVPLYPLRIAIFLVPVVFASLFRS